MWGGGEGGVCRGKVEVRWCDVCLSVSECYGLFGSVGVCVCLCLSVSVCVCLCLSVYADEE